MDDKQSGSVAIALITLVGVITVAAIIRYETPEEALKFWAALAGIVGVLTGAFVTFFFTRGAMQAVKQQAIDAKEEVKYEKTRAEQALNQNAIVRQALTQTAGAIAPTDWSKFVESNLAVKMALEPAIK